MKKISTLVSLILIITVCATSAVLYLNENYEISAGLCIIWILALTAWIGKSRFYELFSDKRIPQNTGNTHKYKEFFRQLD
jgi:hypothetical protein